MKKRRKPGNRRKTGGNVQIVEAGKATRFQAGQSGNPSGRPRDVISQELKRLLGELCPLAKYSSTWAQAIAAAVCARAVAGDVRAFEAICDRVEGQPRQAISLSGGFEVTGLPQMSIEETRKRFEELTAKIRERAEEAEKQKKQPRALPN